MFHFPPLAECHGSLLVNFYNSGNVYRNEIQLYNSKYEYNKKKHISCMQYVLFNLLKNFFIYKYRNGVWPRPVAV